jgi:Mannose-6-phosphate isomerase
VDMSSWTFDRSGARGTILMHRHTNVVLNSIVLSFACMSSAAHTEVIQTEAKPSSEAIATSRSQAQATPSQKSSSVTPPRARESLPGENFTHPAEKTHDPAALFFKFDQLDHWYRVPGEFTHRLNGDQYGFEALSFIITETHPGGGPGLHVHDTEEAHVLLEGSAQYQIGDKTFTVQGPYVVKVPAGVPHTFINVGTKPFNLIAVFPSKHPNTQRIGPNPLIPVRQN